MKRIGVLCLILGSLAMSAEQARSFTTTLSYTPEYTCGYTVFEAKYSASGARYKFIGSCTKSDILVPWTSQGEYSANGGLAKESIALNGNPPYRGSITTKLVCSSDPWFSTPYNKFSPSPCAQGQFATAGEISQLQDLIEKLSAGFMQTQLPNTTGFAYNRHALSFQKDADLQAEQLALAQAEASRKDAQRLQKSVQPAPTLLDNLSPYVVAPTPGSLFLSMTTVPIKLAPPPRRMTVSSYMVKIERKDVQGAWMVVTNLPIGAAQASAPSGYLGWGSGGSDGKSQAFMAMPGTYRISAQVSAPQPTGWSQPIEFVVNAPNKAIQRAPKMFGQ
ncbi:MAG TPA: hypothetical protein PKA61_12165 [Nitrospira sp.]|nr:hypothetical protein [Nitrospira sp.]